MILTTDYCPFCDKIFYPNPTEYGNKDLLIHIKERHQIDEERYRMIIAAISFYEEMNDLCKKLIDSNNKFIEDIREIQKRK